MKAKNHKHNKQNNTDPIYLVFEKNLNSPLASDFTDEEFIENVASDYLKELKQKKAFIPSKVKDDIIEETKIVAKEILLKKIYGCYDLKDFLNKKKKSAA
jgi:hypothetical protein